MDYDDRVRLSEAHRALVAFRRAGNATDKARALEESKVYALVSLADSGARIAAALESLATTQGQRLSIEQFLLECNGVDDLFSHYASGRPIEDTPPL